MIDFIPLFAENIFKPWKLCIPQIPFCLLIGFYMAIFSEVDLQIEFQASKEK